MTMQYMSLLAECGSVILFVHVYKCTRATLREGFVDVVVVLVLFFSCVPV